MELNIVFITILIGVFGLLFGSYATMASHRLPRGEDTIFKRSHCPKCKHILSFIDLLPVFSWTFHHGTCRHCHTNVHWRYPATELAMSILFILVFLQYGLSLLTLSLLVLVICLVIMTVVDFEHKIIPDQLQIIMLLNAPLYCYAAPITWRESLAGGLLALATACILRYGFYVWKKREGLGMGDVKFFLVAGLYLGILPLAPFLLYSGLFGIVIAIIWSLLNKGKKFPFGPALGASLLSCLLYPKYSVGYYYMLAGITV